ncbi:MAG: hypothetical protein HOA04_00810 [Euryarchaeota archaeon]|jgi:hypothetical protein|nr:hypothetical protein [Euryarchaeota archaeon]
MAKVLVLADNQPIADEFIQLLNQDGHSVVRKLAEDVDHIVSFSIPVDEKIEAIMVIPPSSDLIGKKCTIVVHDLVKYGMEEWSDLPFQEWFDSKCQHPPVHDSFNYWLSWRDTLSALIGVIFSKDPLPKKLDICGRRGMTISETFEEFKTLYHRTMRVLDSGMDAQDLEKKASVSFPIIGRSSRPNLNPLHESLLAAGRDDGWRPAYGIGVILMEWLAGKLEAQEGVL